MTDLKFANPAGIPAAEGVFGSFRITQMMSHSSTMYGLARKFALEAAGANLPAVALPIATVIMASTALEAFVGEELEKEKTSGRHPSATIDAILDDRYLSPEERWKKLTELQGAGPIELGREPFQSFTLLVDLRNVLVHRGPRFRAVDEFPSAQVEALKSKFAFGERGMGWEQRVLHGACARWACNTAADMVEEYWRLRGLSPPGGKWELVPEPPKEG
jgi:hypothetical protein